VLCKQKHERNWLRAHPGIAVPVYCYQKNIW
jgi:hypothetical protein